jgi:hypothetical protein
MVFNLLLLLIPSICAVRWAKGSDALFLPAYGEGSEI